MRYQCRDCTYRGDRVSAAGSCPACGSFNVLRARAAPAEAPGKRTWQLRVLVVLWVVLLGLVAHKLLS